jgi:hypothetical protein
MTPSPITPERFSQKGLSCQMSRPLLIFALAGMLLSPATTVQAQIESPHRFTDKTGKVLEATLLGISPDRRTMKIRRVDGQEFELVITQLSLEDQQHLQDWLARQSAPAGTPASSLPASQTPMVPGTQTYRVELTLDRKVSSAEKFNIYSNYNLERRENISTATVRNLTRAPLAGARIEWVIVWRNHVDPEEDGAGGWTYDSLENTPEAVTGKAILEPLPFNRAVTVPIDTIETDTYDYGGDTTYEDSWLGTIARVFAADGTQLVEVRSGSAEFTAMTWEEALALVKTAPTAN